MWVRRVTECSPLTPTRRFPPKSGDADATVLFPFPRSGPRRATGPNGGGYDGDVPVRPTLQLHNCGGYLRFILSHVYNILYCRQKPSQRPTGIIVIIVAGSIVRVVRSNL